MSYDAPTPPPNQPPASPQPTMNIAFNPKAWNIFDLIALGAGVLFFIFSFINRYVSASYEGFGYSVTYGASSWHSWAVPGVLLVLLAVILVAAKSLGGLIPPTVPLALIAAAAAAVGWLLVLLRGLTVDGAHLGWSGWILVILGLIVVAAAVIPLTSAAGNVEAKLNNAVNQIGNHNQTPPPPAN